MQAWKEDVYHTVWILKGEHMSCHTGSASRHEFRESPAILSPPKIALSEKCLTVILARDEDQYCAYCPDLDLVTEMQTPEEAIEDMLEAMEDYAEEYLNDLERYHKSPNRAHHLPYVRAIAGCQDMWELRMLIEILHGRIHL